MKIIKYQICNRVNNGTEVEPAWEDVLYPVEIRCTAAYLEANEEIAKREAYNGEYTVEDDGQPDPEEPQSGDTEIWDELEKAYQEGVDSV